MRERYKIISVIFLAVCFRTFIDPNESFLKNGQDPLLTVMSAGHAVNVFINDEHIGKLNKKKKHLKSCLDWSFHHSKSPF